MTSRRLPSAADIRAAVAEARRAMTLGATPPPSGIPGWTAADPGDCDVCGEPGARVRPSTRSAPSLCPTTVAELFASTRPPRASADADAVLATVLSWAGPPQAGEPPAQIERPDGACEVCGRTAVTVPELAIGAGFALCSDCLAAAAAAIEPGARDAALETEAHAATLEIEDLQRLIAVEGPAVLRGNATIALSLVRLLAAPGERNASALRDLLHRLG